jgi:AmmeMemoRadiSam system protein A
MLTTEQRARLLKVARNCVQAAAAGDPAPDVPTDDPDLIRVQGAFVTLKKRGELRGCIGHIEGHLPLIETVAEMARAAALDDPRFPAVSPREVSELDIEISVMSPLCVVEDCDGIEVGRHGLVVSCGPRRGLLLPQVAPEWGWDRDEFLCHTCMKAGLPSDAWQGKDVCVESFEAEVFGEHD